MSEPDLGSLLNSPSSYKDIVQKGLSWTLCRKKCAAARLKKPAFIPGRSVQMNIKDHTPVTVMIG